MARVAFVQNLAIEYMGIMYLAAVLKQHSHEVDVFIGNGSEKMTREIVNYKPDLIGFTCTTGLHTWCLKMAAQIKERMLTKIIFGGPHPTFFPKIIEEKPVDIICRGEGERAILDIANEIQENKDYARTPNCWFSIDGKIIKNDVRPLIEDLDKLPFPDRRLYIDKYPHLKSSHMAIFTGRGCPFICAYCFNKPLRELYHNKGRYVRKRSVDNVLNEIDAARFKDKVETIYFQDDTFIIDKDWFEEFAVKYKKNINIPYLCLLRVENIDENSIKMLRESNCKNVFFGIETGSEDLRFKLLRKQITDAQIIKAAYLLKKYQIKFRTYNMLGLPDETLKDAFKTVQINSKIKTDYPWCSLFYPYPGTELGSYAIEHNLISDKAYSKSHASFFKSSFIKSAHRDELVNLQKLFFYAVKFPMLNDIIRRLIKLKPNLIFDIFFLVSYAWCYLKSENRKIPETISKGIRNVFQFYFKSN